MFLLEVVLTKKENETQEEFFSTRSLVRLEPDERAHHSLTADPRCCRRELDFPSILFPFILVIWLFCDPGTVQW